MDTITQFPRRPGSHEKGDVAVRAFIDHCDPDWIVSPIVNDYGLDLRVELVRTGMVTGEEFFVQVKGRSSIDSDLEYPPVVRVRQATINYWLGKLAPVLIVVVDLSDRAIAFDWLQYAYDGYPGVSDIERQVPLALRKNGQNHGLGSEVRAYIRQYYSAVRVDVERASGSLYLTRVLLHVAALSRACSRMAIAFLQLDTDDPDDIRRLFAAFLTEFTAHDELLTGLRGGQFGTKGSDTESRLLSLVETRLAIYDQGRDRLFQRKERRDGYWMIRPDYAGLSDFLLPTLGVLEELEEILFQALTLGKIVYVPGQSG